MFRAFTSIDAPQSNLPEVIHASWKNTKQIGVSLLTCTYFDVRDSLILLSNFEDLHAGCYDGGRGPSHPSLVLRNEVREIEAATRLGQDLIDHGVRSSVVAGEQVAVEGALCRPSKRMKQIRNSKICCN